MNTSLRKSIFLSPSIRSEMWLAVCLTAIAGYVDAYALVNYRIYVSFMSGNVTATGSMIGQGQLAAVALMVLAMLFFMAGALLGNWLGNSKLQNPRLILFGMVTAAIAITIGCTLALPSGLPAAAAVPVSLLTLAMGMMNATHAESLSLTAMTGTVYRVAAHLALGLAREPVPGAQGAWDTHLHRAADDARILAAFMAGAIVAGAASYYFHVWALLPPLLAVGTLTLVVLRNFARSTPKFEREDRRQIFRP
jgi:uncharacterized membrane protein YoaK (UPF0700 family)